MKPVKQRVFLVRSALGRVREQDAQIVSGPKMTWAQIGARRYLLGTTAFFTLQAANARKAGLLREMRDAVALDRIPGTRGHRDDARRQLARYAETGTFLTDRPR